MPMSNADRQAEYRARRRVERETGEPGLRRHACQLYISELGLEVLRSLAGEWGFNQSSAADRVLREHRAGAAALERVRALEARVAVLEQQRDAAEREAAGLREELTRDRMILRGYMGHSPAPKVTK